MACNILQRGHISMTTLNHQTIHHEQSLTLNTVALIFLLKTNIFPTLTYNAYSNCQITSQHPWKWKILHLLHNWTDHLACGIMLYTSWTIGSIQQAHIEQQFLVESTQPFSAITNSMKWLICLMKLFGLGSWQLWI